MGYEEFMAQMADLEWFYWARYIHKYVFLHVPQLIEHGSNTSIQKGCSCTRCLVHEKPWLVKWSRKLEQKWATTRGLNPAIPAYMITLAFPIVCTYNPCNKGIHLTYFAPFRVIMESENGLFLKDISFKHHDSSVLHLCWICLVVRIPRHFNNIWRGTPFHVWIIQWVCNIYRHLLLRLPKCIGKEW